MGIMNIVNTTQTISADDVDEVRVLYGSLCTDPERIVYPNRLIGKFECIVGRDYSITPQDFVNFINANIVEIIKGSGDLTPTNFNFRVDQCDGDITYEIYADILETETDYEKRMKVVKEVLERRQNELDENADATVAQKAKKAWFVLLDDPELAEYIRLREKFKLYEFYR